MNRIEHYQLFADCVITKGATRAAICDLTRHRYNLIPLNLAELLLHGSFTEASARADLFDDNNSIALDNLEFLLQHDFIFQTTHFRCDYFSPLSKQHNYPGHLENGIFEIGQDMQYDLEYLFKRFIALGGQHIQLISFDWLSPYTIKELINTVQSFSFHSVELFVPYKIDYEKHFWDTCLRKNNRIKSLVIFSSPHSSLENFAPGTGIGNSGECDPTFPIQSDPSIPE